ncbi:MAG: GatB/YqeY domain-containing protein [Parcubacteria group bacterium]|nr:GatB/YqeY domain-containing protein [Parcubacteria group bacterium]
MALKEKLQNDLNSALKAREDLKRLVLGSLLSAIHNKEIEKRTVKARETPTASAEELEKASGLSDEEILKALQSEIKKRKEAIELYQKGGREELAQKEKDEINILIQYAPEQMSEDELRKIVKEAIAETGAKEIKDMGKVIAAVMAKVKGAADGSEVSKIVKEELIK